jgi:hypothetical protein
MNGQVTRMNSASNLSRGRTDEDPAPVRGHSGLLAAIHGLLAAASRAAADPVTSERTFIGSYPGKIEQVRLVRAALAPLLAGCPVAGDALLIGSELAANAALHSDSGAPGGHFTVRADIRPGDCVWIEVDDQGGAWGGRGADERPHGLDLVHLLAGNGNWGVDGGDQGRTVWVRLDWPAS